MIVKEAMHRGVDWVSPDTPIAELAKLMREHDIGAIPIGENDHLERISAGLNRDSPEDLDRRISWH